MKTLSIITFFFLISQNMGERCDDNQNAKSISDCKDLELTPGDAACCFVDEKYTMFGEDQIVKKCIGATKEQSENITLFKEEERKSIESEGFDGRVKYINITCENNYIYISLLSLMIISLLL